MQHVALCKIGYIFINFYLLIAFEVWQVEPIWRQCYISILPESLEISGFLMFSVRREMKHWLEMVDDAEWCWLALYRIFLFKISLLWALGKKTNRYLEMGLLWKIFTKNYSFVQTGRKFYSFNGHTGNNNKILIRRLCDFIHVFHLQLLQLENFLHFLDLLFS